MTKKSKKTTTAIGRPTKIHAFIDEFKKQMSIDKVSQQVIFLTDAEMVFLINEMLPKKDRICDMTFRRWKAKHVGEKQTDFQELDEVGAEFCSLYKKALIQQKAALFDKLTDKKEYSWQKWAWIIERKFDDWNIRHKLDNNVNVNQKQITIVKNYNDKIE